ncbi:Dyp-type peroxidase domain-containing protein [Streptosporangium album]|uniref:Dyp-type peroxidase domain-containing protein n=1 Tax=Streptosporangium album TaxID=47479 RepID=UPI0031F127DB
MQEGRLSCVTGIGSRAWDRLFAGPRPVELPPSANWPDASTVPWPHQVTCCSASGPAAAGWTGWSSIWVIASWR